jgi:uncharacterized protein YjiS (DUF1127 family)
MSVTMQRTHSELHTHSLLHTLHNQILAYLERRRTIRALKACSQHDLQDMGIIPQDIVELQHSSAADAVDALSIKAGLRAGNW